MKNKLDFTKTISTIPIDLDDELYKLGLLRAKELKLPLNEYVIYLLKKDLNI